MLLPQLNVISTSRNYTQEFLGYNHNLRIGDGEFFDTKNLTTDFYPLISPRVRRGLVQQIAQPGGLIAKDTLAWVDGTKLVYGGQEYELALEPGEKQLVGMGAYILVFPDGKYLNTENLTDFGSLGQKFTTTGTVKFTLCQEDGTIYENVTVSDTAPEDPKAGDIWVDTSQTPHSFKIYSGTTSMWTSIGVTYVKIEAANIGKGFEQYDGVFLSGCVAEGTEELNNTAVIWQKGDDFIVVIGLLEKVVSQTEPVTVERRIPQMDFVTESNNRIWGCRYGMQGDESVNELYACKLGDPKNWYCYQGVSTDSYAVSLGSDGIFTGAVTHLGYPLFFKENCFHKVYGEVPSNFQILSTNCRGVQNGCAKSLAIVNEVLFYKSQTGICAFDGSLPSGVSEALGQAAYSEAAGGSYGNKYYVSMKDEADNWQLFVYDTKRGVWMREDESHGVEFCRCRGELYMLDAEHRLWALNGTQGERETQVEWMAQTGEIGYSYPDKKYLSRLNIRMKLEKGSSVDTYVRYDSHPGNGWEFVGHMTGHTVQTFTLPIVPRRCDHMAIRFVGKGDCKIFSIAKVLEIGSDEG